MISGRGGEVGDSQFLQGGELAVAPDAVPSMAKRDGL